MKVGDYVRINRANRTYIRKIISLYDINVKREKQKLLILDKSFEGCRYSVRENKVLKSSSNIIDLIEVGDYVNGQLVKHIAYFEGVEEPIKKLIFADEYHLIPIEVCEQNEIKSIVTKEQFEAMEYKCE